VTLILRRSELEQLVDETTAVPIVAAALTAAAEGTAFPAGPFVLPTGADDAKYLVMAAYDGVDGLAVAKLLADLPGNRSRGLPAQRSIIVLSSRTDGAPVAVLDGRIPTRERTAATTAVATQALARPDAQVLGLLGAGGLGEPHIRAIRHVRDIRRVVVWSRSRDTAERLAAGSDDDLEVVVSEDPEEVATADIVCTLTPSREPVLRGEWLRPGTHVNAVGAPPRADHREIDGAVLARSTVFVDDRESALQEAGAVLIAIAEGHLVVDDLVATLGEVLAGHHPGRTRNDEITLFNSVGMGLEDLAICAHYARTAAARGLGLDIDLAA
jgi:alanine dehydrogenase